jgi:hypothetical protein
MIGKSLVDADAGRTVRSSGGASCGGAGKTEGLRKRSPFAQARKLEERKTGEGWFDAPGYFLMLRKWQILQGLTLRQAALA